MTVCFHDHIFANHLLYGPHFPNFNHGVCDPLGLVAHGVLALGVGLSFDPGRFSSALPTPMSRFAWGLESGTVRGWTKVVNVF